MRGKLFTIDSEGYVVLIKICGITSIEMAKVAEDAGANMIGFVFAASSRKVAAEQASEIAGALSPLTKKVGVFVNESKAEIERIADIVGLDFIQLHGDELPEFAASLSRPVIKAFTIDEVTDETLATYPAEYFLIDSPGTTYRGGSGNTFDWNRLENREIDKRKLLLAGGLHAKNVQEAIRAVQPAGVDVSSGVETNGAKDAQKIRAFVAAARR